MAKAKKLVNIVAINDGSSDAPIMFHFDNEATRTEFLKHVEPRYGEFTIINVMSERDAKVLRAAVDPVTMEDLNDAISTQDQGTVQEAFEDSEFFRFYDCGDELRDLYDEEIENGNRVHGTGRTC